MTTKHKVFVSYHHDNDEGYKQKLERICSNVMISRSVEIGDIDPNLKTETIRQKIRDEFLRDSSVTIVLIGKQTWQRKHVDWEISSSIRNTPKNPRSGLIGILLPTHLDYKSQKYSSYNIPPRLWDNAKCEYALVYDWTENPSHIQSWIHQAYLRKSQVNPDSSRPLFGKNRTGTQWQ